MEVISEFGLMTAQLWQVNACHMYLQVTTLAKITDHTGTTLLTQAISAEGGNLQQLQLISYLLLTWPAIHHPVTHVGSYGTTQLEKSLLAQPTATISPNHLEPGV